MYPPAVARRRLVAALLVSGLALSAFAAGLLAARGARGQPPPVFAQGETPDAGHAADDGWRRSVASWYDDYGQELACGGTLTENRLGVASRTLPCGTRVTFRYRGRMLELPVIDRGPFVAGREWDLTGAAAEALGFAGVDEVSWRL